MTTILDAILFILKVITYTSGVIILVIALIILKDYTPHDNHPTTPERVTPGRFR